jgi:hypothetical protein
VQSSIRLMLKHANGFSKRNGSLDGRIRLIKALTAGFSGSKANLGLVNPL